MKAVLIMLCSLLPMTLAAQAPNTLTQAEIQQGWTLLWDGKTGAGWHTASGEAIPNESWTIANGILLDHADGGHGHGHSGDLLTDGDYRNFELSVDSNLHPVPIAASSISSTQTRQTVATQPLASSINCSTITVIPTQSWAVMAIERRRPFTT